MTGKLILLTNFSSLLFSLYTKSEESRISTKYNYLKSRTLYPVKDSFKTITVPAERKWI
jgi:hypothetical protein